MDLEYIPGMGWGWFNGLLDPTIPVPSTEFNCAHFASAGYPDGDFFLYNNCPNPSPYGICCTELNE